METVTVTVCDCLFLLAMSPTTTQNMPLNKKIMPPPSTTSKEKRMLPTSNTKGLLVDACSDSEVLDMGLVVVKAIIIVGSVSVVVTSSPQSLSDSVPGTVQLNFAVGEVSMYYNSEL